jgi:hypothetical protein
MASERPKNTSRFNVDVDSESYIKLRVKLMEAKPRKSLRQWLEAIIAKEVNGK